MIMLAMIASGVVFVLVIGALVLAIDAGWIK